MIIATLVGLGVCLGLLAHGAKSAMAKLAIAGLFLGSAALYWASGRPQWGDFSHYRQQTLLNQALEAEGISRDEVAASLVKLEESLKADPEDRVGWLMLARGYRVLNLAEKSERALLSGISQFPKDAELVRELGRLKMAQGRYRQALDTFNRSLALAAEVDTLRLALAAATWLGDKEAIAHYERRLGEAAPP